MNRSFLRIAICLAAFVVATSAHGQLRRSLTDSLIARSLSMVDLVSFEWTGTPEPLRPRVGIYVNGLPADTIKAMTKGAKQMPGFRVWHLMPHWPADAGGMLIGDVILTMNGKPIGDSVSSGDEYIGGVARDMSPGDTARFTIVRNGAVRELAFPVYPAKRTPMSFTAPSHLGPVRSNTWLQEQIEKHALGELATTVKKQIRIITDQDFCTVPFSDRPSPWRLNAITYLQHHPMRLGAYSRSIVQDLWDGVGAEPGLAGALDAAARHLDISTSAARRTTRPRNIEELTTFLDDVQTKIDGVYGRHGDNLASHVDRLAKILSFGESPEDAIDTTSDPARKRQLRLESEKEMAALFRFADGIDLKKLTEAAKMLATLADTTWMRSFAASITPPTTPVTIDGVEGEILAAWNTPAGTCVIGGYGPNRYTGDLRFVFDPAGDDSYELSDARFGSYRLIADMAGDDRYRSAKSGQGAGVGCVDMLVDASGNDSYRASRYSQGAGLLGIGMLADFAGDDTYTSGWCSQGGAFLGIGLLYEGGGADSYTADAYSQAFGYIKGFGTILDRSGNDSYRAGWKYEDPLRRIPHKAYLAMSQGFGYGMRPWTMGVGADGGIGALADLDGDDVYASDMFSQGGSYWYALGILHDGNGTDRYTGGQYSQGSGIHLAFGALLDDAGDDTYDTYAGLEQGNAHDWSAGCLEDASGNDTYRGAGTSQGAGLNVSFAWLLDGGGNDQYYALLSDTMHSQGGGNYNRVRRSGSLGVLIDLGNGADYYVEERATPGAVVVKGSKGFLYDDGPAVVGDR